MGITYINGTVTGPTGKEVALEFLVDSGSIYTLLPNEVWQGIELSPKRAEVFRMADGTPIDRRVSECYIDLPQGGSHTVVILGEPGDQPLLGAYTLEGLGLVLNPFTRTLHPMRLLLA